MVRVCCFCDKIHDDAIGRWQEHRGCASPDATGENLILSYTCCHQCFNADPRANVFRARQSRSAASRHETRGLARSRQLISCEAAS
jgi:hypothetical protein